MSSEAQLKKWVTACKKAGPALKALKRAELRSLKTPDALRTLKSAFAHALKTARPTQTSGLVEQQRYFKKLAR